MTQKTKIVKLLVCPKCGGFDKAHDAVDGKWICRNKDCKNRYDDNFKLKY